MTLPFRKTYDNVVYTAVLGGVDTLRPPGYVDDDWDYVCFSEEPIDCPPWRPAPVELRQPSLAREARYLKVNATTVLPTAKVSLWVDGNIQPMTSPQALLERYLESCDLAMHRHQLRECLFDEAVAVIDQGKDATATVLAQMLRYARSGVPAKAGLYAGAAILRRHTPAVRELEETWWAEIARGSYRDQLSLPYALGIHGVEVAAFDSDVRRGPLFQYRTHDGPNAPRKIKLPDGRRRRAVVPPPHLPEGVEPTADL